MIPECGRIRLRWPFVAAFPAEACSHGKELIFNAGEVQLDFRTGGVVCTIDIPAPRGARDE
jgi:hypothetical protein